MKHALFVAAAVLVVALAGCSDDSSGPRPPTKDTPSYKNLTQPWHVLNNLELAYNDMNIVEYQRIFDPTNFTFFFYSGDDGGTVPVSWGYADEIQSATRLFTHQPDKNGEHPIISVDVDLYDVETATWTDIPAPPEFAGETWKTTTVNYDFTIVTEGDLTYIPKGSPAGEFTVRKIDDKWKLVVWQDRASGSGAAASSGTSEEASWSEVKVLYQ